MKCFGYGQFPQIQIWSPLIQDLVQRHVNMLDVAPSQDASGK